MDLNNVDLDMVDLEPEGDEQIVNASNSVEGAIEQDFGYNEISSIQETNPIQEPIQSQENQKDVMTEFLKFNGISDLDHIKFEDEDGIIKDRSWNDLSFEEKMNILTTSSEQPERDLTDDEINLVNDIRSRNLSPEQYINTIRQQAAKDYMDSLNGNPQYSIDDLTDEEIFMLDMQDKIEDVTDEELRNALDKAKEDPLFEKRMTGIRKSLKEQEEYLNNQMNFEREQIENQQFENFKNQIIGSIQNFNKVGDLDINLEVEDMEDIASFILDRDDTGMSYMGKTLNDPRALVEMAWWTLKGRDALNSISEYFSNEIKNIRQASYQKGLEDGRNNSSKVVYNKSQVNNKPIESSYGGVVILDDILG